jgi:2-(1,2-epoxy-1,2-dihydrophenyl)acetyl-CoA isomerase
MEEHMSEREYRTILVSRDGPIETITLNRPERKNPLGPETVNELLYALDDAREAADVRVVVLTGAGKAFSAGADLKLMSRADRLGRSALVGRQRNLHGSGVVERIMRREKPMIAALNGVAAGMACAYVLACDFAIAHATARFVFGFVRLAFVPDSGTTYLLTRRIGVAAAQKIILTGEPVDAVESLRLGLVSEVASAESFAARVAETAAAIAAQPPQAVKLARGLLTRAVDGDFRQAVEAEALAQGILGETEDHKEAVRAFVEKRKPIFTGK